MSATVIIPVRNIQAFKPVKPSRKRSQNNETEHNREKDYISNPFVIADVGFLWSDHSSLQPVFTPSSKEPIRAEIERRTKSLRAKSDKPVGGQAGHEGTTRKMVDTPDEIEEVSSHYCRQCGRDLSEIEGVLDYVTQEIDLPPVMPIYRERRFYKKICSCGCCNRDYAPRRRGGNAITFGKNIRAIATYLSFVQCMPYERLQSLFATMFNVSISQGTLVNIVREMLDKSRPAIELIECQFVLFRIVLNFIRSVDP